MTQEQRDVFLREIRIAKLATLTEDGSPTTRPIWYEWTGEQVLMFSARETRKIENIRRDPRVAVTVEEPVGRPEAWVTIEGRAEVEHEGGFELASRLAPLYTPPRRPRARSKAGRSSGRSTGV
jgi:PPOX class probable F420-dependent enzyme